MTHVGRSFCFGLLKRREMVLRISSRIWYVALLFTMLIITGCPPGTIEHPEPEPAPELEVRQNDVDPILKNILDKADNFREIPQLKTVLDDSCPTAKE
jgi:hypothetical protein